MLIDAHHHLWRYQPGAFGWIAPGSALACDHDMLDFRQAMAMVNVDAAISVQARQCDAETDFLLANAAADPSVIGVVGWIDLRADDIVERIADRPAGPLVGYRHVVQDEPDPKFLLDPRFVDGVRAVLEAGLAYDILVNAEQFSTVPAFIDLAGEGRFVLDHAAKPAIVRNEWQPWADRIRQAAAHPQLFCKLSGLVTEADHAAWTSAQFEPYLAHLFEQFGPDRLIWGSDWPVSRLAATYADTFGIIDGFVMRHCPEAWAGVFSGNAIRAYGLSMTPKPDR